MSYTLLGSGASWLAAHAMTARAADAEYHGGCDSDPDEGVLVLDDGGNQHALIVEGSHDELRAFAQRVTDAVALITGAGVLFGLTDETGTTMSETVRCPEHREPGVEYVDVTGNDAVECQQCGAVSR